LQGPIPQRISHQKTAPDHIRRLDGQDVRVAKLGVNPDFSTKLVHPIRARIVLERNLERNANSLNSVEGSVNGGKTTVTQFVFDTVLTQDLLGFDNKRTNHSHAAGARALSGDCEKPSKVNRLTKVEKC
jgi:hypothetical protein